LYDYLCTIAKPQATNLFTAIHVDGQKARQRAKQQSASDETIKRRADLGDLISLGNVELRRVEHTKLDKRSRTGLEKVVQYALWERGLSSRSTKATQKKRNKRLVSKGTRREPKFERLISGKAAGFVTEQAELRQRLLNAARQRGA